MMVMNHLLLKLKLLVRSLFPLKGTRAERKFQRILIRSGWTVEGFDNNRVFFTVRHNGQQYRSCLDMQTNGLASLCILGRVAVFDALVNDMQSLFASFNDRQDLPCVYSILPNGDRHCHVTTWTTHLESLRSSLLRSVVCKVVHYCSCNDQFAIDMYQLQLNQEAKSGDAKARRGNSHPG